MAPFISQKRTVNGFILNDRECFSIFIFFQTSTERLMYKPINAIDLTASQLTNSPSIDTTVQELEDVLGRRLTLEEIQVTLVHILS